MRLEQLMRAFSKSALLLVLAACFSIPVIAQKGGGRSGGSHSASPANAPTSSTSYRPMSSESEFNVYDVTAPGSPPQKIQTEQPSCFHWPMNPILGSTVDASRMAVPAKAQSEFSDGCAAVRSKDFISAEEHLKKAVSIHPKFAAAWALLGQAEKDQGHNDQAVELCTKARESDASYLAGYLCLADLAVRRNKWAEAADLTNQVIRLHPLKAPSAYFHNCVANFYLKQWNVGEESALREIAEGPKAYEPQVRWLLAKIYEVKGQRGQEAVQLREYLKLSPHSPNAAVARHVLRQIESRTAEGRSATIQPTKEDR